MFNIFRAYLNYLSAARVVEIQNTFEGTELAQARVRLLVPAVTSYAHTHYTNNRIY